MNFIHVILSWLLGASVRAAVLSIAVLGLRALLRRWFPARSLYALWLPVIAILIAPELAK